METLNLGADTGLFTPVTKEQRPQLIEILKRSVNGITGGKSRQQSEELIRATSDKKDFDSWLSNIYACSSYTAKLPDEDIVEKLGTVNWEKDPVMLFVGRLIASKGIQLILAALPYIVQKFPSARLVIVGHGPQREGMELLLHALRKGDLQLLNRVVNLGKGIEDGNPASFSGLKRFYNQLQNNGKLDACLSLAKNRLQENSVIFTGYLKHAELRWLFPCSDISIFPSVVAEAGPLVFLEALASGSFPMGTYFAGMKASIDTVSGALEEDHAELMKLSKEPRQAIVDIAEKVPKVLSIGDRYKQTLRSIAVEKFDWKNIAFRFGRLLNEMK